MKTRILIVTVAAAAGLSVLCGCGKQARVQRALARAEAFQAEGRTDRAEIAYLSVLRMDPNRTEAVSGLGQLYYHQGRWVSAITMLIRTRELAPDDVGTRGKLALLMFLADDLKAARAEALEVLRLQPANDEAVLVLVATSIEPAQMDEARTLIAGLETGTGDRAVLHLAEAAFLLRESRLGEAEAEARRAIQLSPDLAAAHVTLGNILKSLGRQDEAREAFQQSFAFAAPRSPRKLLWPKQLIESGAAVEAEKLLSEMLEQAPDFLPASLLMAEACLRQGKLEAGEVWVNNVMERDAANPQARLLLARIKLAGGEVAEGREILSRLSNQSAASLRIQYELARAQYLDGDIPSALATLEGLLQSNPESVPVRLLLAQVYLVSSDPASAVRVVKPLLQVDPDYRPALLLLAEARRQTGELPDAAGIYRRLTSANARDIEAHYRLGQVLLLQGEQDTARETLEAILKIDPANLPAMALLADLDVRSQDLSAAVERLKAQVGRDPQSPGARFLLGQVHLARRDHAAAEAQFQEVIRLAPAFQPAYLLLVRSYKASDRTHEAREELHALLEVHPQDSAALLLLAAIEEQEGDVEEAAGRYEEVLKHHPGNLMALNNLAYLQLQHFKDVDRALELASAARKLAPHAPSVADTFGWVLFHRGEYPRALLFLKEAAAQLGANADVLHHLGMAAYMNDQEDLARQSFQAALKVDPASAHREEIGRRLAILAIEPGAADAGSLARLRQTLADQPSDPVALKRLAAQYQQEGDARRLAELYERALELAPESVPLLVQYAGVCLEVLGDQEKAMTLARSARRLAPQDPEVAHTLGKLAFSAGDHTWAASLLGESAARLAGRPDVQFDAALAYYSVGRLDEAQKAMQLVMTGGDPSVDPPRTGTFLEMLARHRALGDPQAALQRARTILVTAPDDVPATFVEGLALEALGDARGAAKAYDRVLAVYPGFVPAIKRLALLNAGQLGDDQKAFDYGRQARQALRDDPELNRTLGLVAYRRGDYPYAAQLLGESLPAYPEDAELLFHLGLAQCRAGDRDAGRQSLSRATLLAPDHPLSGQARQVLEQL